MSSSQCIYPGTCVILDTPTLGECVHHSPHKRCAVVTFFVGTFRAARPPSGGVHFALAFAALPPVPHVGWPG